MITSIEIDGFKSLRNFKMDFRPGLNVLAGPNGSGKTNILQALELFSYLCTKKINDAFEAVEQYGELFCLEASGKISRQMTFRVTGSLNRYLGTNVARGNYVMGFTVERGLFGYSFSAHNYSFDGFVGVVEDYGRFRSRINAIVEKDKLGNWLEAKVTSFGEDTWPDYYGDREPSKEITYLLTLKGIDDLPLISSNPDGLGWFGWSGSAAVLKDCEEITYYSITPSGSIMPSKISHPIKLKSSGERLTRVLYALEEYEEKHLGFSDLNEVMPYRFVEEREVLDYLELVFKRDVGILAPAVSGNKDISIYLNIKNGNDENTLYSIESLSEGTISWIALSIALLSHLSGWCFDEPDRHLHPDMITHMVSLFREHSEKGFGWLLMSTHSETVLNELEPEELVIVENGDNFTRVRPIHSIEKFREARLRDGKHLGYYYVAGAL